MKLSSQLIDHYSSYAKRWLVDLGYHNHGNGYGARPLLRPSRLNPKRARRLVQLCKLPPNAWLLWARTWSWIDCLLMTSFPKDVIYRCDWYFCLLGRFVDQSIKTNDPRIGVTECVKFWKEFVSHLRWRIFGKIAHPLTGEKLSDFSRYPQPYYSDECGDEYATTVLYDRNRRPTRHQVSRWCRLASTRGLPVGWNQKESLTKHQNTLLRPPECEFTDELEVYSRKAGAELLTFVDRFFKEDATAHCSVSNSACFEYSREEGGR